VEEPEQQMSVPERPSTDSYNPFKSPRVDDQKDLQVIVLSESPQFNLVDEVQDIDYKLR